MPPSSLDDDGKLGGVGFQLRTLSSRSRIELHDNLIVPGLGDAPAAHVAYAMGQAPDLELLALAGTDGDFFADAIIQCHRPTIGNVDRTGALD